MSKQTIKLDGGVLYLTSDTSLIDKQINEGLTLKGNKLPLMDNISTDETTPSWTCFWYDDTLSKYCMIGLRDGVVKEGDVKKLNANILVAGRSKGCGSSREHAPYSELLAGFKVVIAESFEKIYAQNSRNIGLLISTDFSLLERLERGEEIPIDAFCEGLDKISSDIVKQGGLFKYNLARMSGDISVPRITTEPRPLNIAEKIIARNTVVANNQYGVVSVKPGDALFCKADVRFTHDYSTAMCGEMFYRNFGENQQVTDKDSQFAFRDHLTFVGSVLKKDPRKAHLIEVTDTLAENQRDFCREQQITLYDEVGEGSQAICHNGILEDIGLPGDVIIGTDSHTCTAGALGALAFGVGSTDMANAMFTKDIQINTPGVIKIELVGELPKWVAAKDIVLHIMTNPIFKNGESIGKVLEYTGAGIRQLGLDERATLTNMAVEAGAMTAIVQADESVVQYLVKKRGLDREYVESRIIQSDPGATYAYELKIDLSTLSPVVATPGDPRNGISLSEHMNTQEPVKIDIAYGGSCTGSKCEDMDMYAEVFKLSLEAGKKVHPDVNCYIQFGSQFVKQYAREKGYIEIFENVGVKTIDPSCGACINAGPGSSEHAGQVSISAINRNFPGRSGPGEVYLASPYLVAASAIAGTISGVEDILKN
ncbi:aconitase family protein [Pseudoalteromonas piscicida]|uniref:3-isopropylmalate dehydratase n=1 Tax=Pseudoalteromonas piscicida TaxID=43662 RepID=A0A2A5JMR1_PSEO7|nr:aconitase family protein [Pseudoalteromonas piscicida]PCK30718.1 3-isopropylmalate dehydratase [Pseudoalteromonas piscicida]